MWQLSMVLAVVSACLLLRYYREKGTRLYVLVPVGISWSLGFFFFLVLPFDLENRTFRLATGAVRELWFIVMHPRETGAPGRRRKNASQSRSALSKAHAEALLSHIKEVFLEGSLLGEGIEPSWVLNGEIKQTITYNK